MMRNLQPGLSENAPNRPGCGASPNTGPESRFRPATAICSPTSAAAPSAVAARSAAIEDVSHPATNKPRVHLWPGGTQRS
jgi:hypothetical protein